MMVTDAAAIAEIRAVEDESVAERFSRARALSLALAENLSDADASAQSIPAIQDLGGKL